MDMDRISQLTQPILHHILSFLSQKEAVQTSVLSKTWRYLWFARPNLEFREEWFMRNNENFLPLLGNTLQRYHDQNLSIQDYMLEMLTPDINPRFSGEWIPKVMLNLGLKTFKLCFNSCSLKYFDMPSVVFQAKSLQELELQRCKLNFDNNSTDNLFLLSNLRKLDLRYVQISEETLEHVLSSCPLIDFLTLNCCELLRTINLKKALNLKHFGFQAYYRNESSPVIHIPTTLQSIRTASSPNWFFHPENNYFSHLKSLHLICVKLSADSFDKFSSEYCPCLEKLTLRSCYNFRRFKLSSRSITHLEILIDAIKGFKAAIDAPNILYFRFSSTFVPSISFKTTSVKWESHISLRGGDENDAFWFQDLKELLKALSHSRIHLELRPFEYRHIEEDTNGGGDSSYEPVQIEELRFDGLFSCSSFPDILSCLLIRTCRPNYIHMSLLFKKYICSCWERDRTRPVTILLGELEIPSWKNDLEKSSMEVWNKNAGEWCCVEWTRLTEDEWFKRPDFRFRMKWRELK